MSSSDNSRARAMKWPYRRYEPFERELRRTAQAWFKAQGYAVHQRYPFILDDLTNWKRNVIVPEVADYVEREMKAREQNGHQGFPLHKYVHHGLSSQAMLFNLVGPLILRGDLSPLETAFRAAGANWPKGKVNASLEYEDRDVFNEDTAQPTSIDLAIRDGETTGGMFVECKFVEKEFGGCSVFGQGNCDGKNPAANLDCCYLHFIGRTYWSRMAEHGILEGPIKTSLICPMANYYQFFREVLFALHKHGTYVLLYDPRNPTFVADGALGQRGLYPFLTSMLPEPVRAMVKKVTVQEVFEAIKASGRHGDWAGKFGVKYGLTA